MHNARRLIPSNKIWAFFASAASIGPIYLYAKDSKFRTLLKPELASAHNGNTDDMIASLIKQEFSVDLSKANLSPTERAKIDYKLKTREEHLKHLKDPSTEFDILVIGGGCNGTGVVLDAASRGLKCAVIDSFDFAAGTSSKSTKLAHGGIRYFQ